MVGITRVFLVLKPFVLLRNTTYLTVSSPIAIEQVLRVVLFANAITISATRIVIIDVSIGAKAGTEGHYI